MSLRRRAHAADAGLDPEVRDLLLLGWSGDFPTVSFAIFDLSQLQLRDVWRQHQAAVREEAARRGLTVIWAEQYFDRHPPAWLREDGDGQ